MRREAQADARGGPPRGAARWCRRAGAIAVVAALLPTACGGSDDPSSGGVSSPTTDDATSVSGDGDSVDLRDVDLREVDVAGGDEVPVPVARFVAAGPGEPNTFGPMCATDIDDRGDDMFRVTAPADWSWSGSSGGSGPDEVDFDTPFGRVTIEFFRSADELSTFGSYVTVGETVAGTVTLGDEEFPLVEMSSGEEPALGFTGVPYFGPLPIAGTHEATVVMSSPEPIDPATAAAVLSTVRAERCGIVSDSAIWGGAGGVQLVPRFEVDPLAKSYPDGDQPQVAPGAMSIANFSLDQISYLLSFDESLSTCLAPLLIEAAEADPIVNTMMISPANAPADLLDELIGQCS